MDRRDGIGRGMKKPAQYDALIAQASAWGSDGHYGRARSCRLSAAKMLGRHTKSEWAAVKEAVGVICPRCERVTHHFYKDHIIPIYDGGSDGLDNIQPLCASCNSQKGPERINWFKKRGYSI